MSNNSDKFANAVYFWVSAALIGILAGLILTSCDAPIPIDPQIDTCAIEGVEDCCPAAPECDPNAGFVEGYRRGWDDGYEDGQDACTPNKPGKGPRKPHKGRKPRTHSDVLDDVLDAGNDPLGGLSENTCTTTCYPNPALGTTYCVTTCNQRAV
jgi:hypothetical protein